MHLQIEKKSHASDYRALDKQTSFSNEKEIQSESTGTTIKVFAWEFQSLITFSV